MFSLLCNFVNHKTCHIANYYGLIHILKKIFKVAAFVFHLHLLVPTPQRDSKDMNTSHDAFTHVLIGANYDN